MSNEDIRMEENNTKVFYLAQENFIWHKRILDVLSMQIMKTMHLKK